MHRDTLKYTEAFELVSSKRPSIYPNVGFQLQLCLFERQRFAASENKDFDVASEIAISIDRTLDNVHERMEAMFDDADLRDDPARWMDFGFFFQNCREYLGHVDIGLPFDVIHKAQDVARRLKNLELVFEGAGVATASRVGRVLDVWQNLQLRLSSLPGAMPRVDLAHYASVLDHDGRDDRDDDAEPKAKRRRED
mmetsp:Transcript_22723/g.71144  ORF Transcript_22723/g.71144 Transcript_22723/m.71144 type:complete len:195 (+) Transcript_22723:530-1114(+)